MKVVLALLLLVGSSHYAMAQKPIDPCVNPHPTIAKVCAGLTDKHIDNIRKALDAYRDYHIKKNQGDK